MYPKSSKVGTPRVLHQDDITELIDAAIMLDRTKRGDFSGGGLLAPAVQSIVDAAVEADRADQDAVHSGTFALAGAARADGLSSGLLPANFRKWRAKVAAVRAGTGQAKVIVLGDSTSGGGGTNSMQNTWAQLLWKYLNAYTIPCQPGIVIPTNTIIDTRWGIGAGWSPGGYGWGGGATYSAPAGVATTLDFHVDPGVSVDTFDIWTLRGPFGTMQAQVDALGNSPVVTAGADGMIKTTVTCPAGTGHVLHMGTITGGSVFVVGVDAYLSTAGQVRVGNCAISGLSSTNYAAGSAWSGPGAQIPYAADLTIIMLGVNDYTSPVANLQANLQIIIDNAKLSGDVILASHLPSKEDTPNWPFEQACYPMLKALALSNNVGFVDIFSRMGTWTFANSEGFMFDALHPTATGYGDIASAMAAAVAAIL